MPHTNGNDSSGQASIPDSCQAQSMPVRYERSPVTLERAKGILAQGPVFTRSGRCSKPTVRQPIECVIAVSFLNFTMFIY